jgi:hypothetical protein
VKENGQQGLHCSKITNCISAHHPRLRDQTHVTHAASCFFACSTRTQTLEISAFSLQLISHTTWDWTPPKSRTLSIRDLETRHGGAYQNIGILAEYYICSGPPSELKPCCRESYKCIPTLNPAHHSSTMQDAIGLFLRPSNGTVYLSGGKSKRT